MIKNKYFVATALIATVFSANVWAECTMWENCTITSHQNNDGTITITESYSENSKTIIQDTDGNQISAELHTVESNVSIPSEIESFSYTPDDYAERYTTIHYGASDDDIIGQTIEYWGTGDKGEWGATEVYNGTLLVMRSAQWASGDDDPEGESFEITYTYDDNGNLISSTETRYAMNDDWDWDQTSSQTKTYEVSKPKKRIYTVEEASKLVKPQGNTFRIKYK